jgi:ABC-2 type transport system permease protein
MNVSTPITQAQAERTVPRAKSGGMLGHIASFEFRYQLKNPVFWVTAGIFFLLTFGAVTVEQIQMGDGGNVKENAPHANAMKHLIMSLFFMFVATAFVANVIVRDDDTGYGPIIRSTRITKFDYLFGRFIGALGISALTFLAVPLAILFGSLMPWIDQETLGPNHLSYYAVPYLALALPNVIVLSAIFFALATATRSMMATYIGVVVLLVLWTVVNQSLSDRPDLRNLQAMLDPFGIGAYTNETRYWTAAERNTLTPNLSGMILTNRLIWLGVAAAALGLAYAVFRFAEKGVSKRKQKKAKLLASVEAAPIAAAPAGPLPRASAKPGWSQLKARTSFEMRQVFRSPAFPVLIAVGLFNAVSALAFAGEGLFGTATYPTTRELIPLLNGTFSLIPIIIAIYYAGELVWRERDRKMHEIVDATPLPNWAYVVPKTLAVSLVLITTLLISVLAAVIVQAAKGYTNFELGKYLVWYVAPLAWDFTLVAILAVFIQALSPNKYVGWGLMVLYLILQIVASNIGLEHNLFVYGQAPQVPLSDLNDQGHFWKGAWWFRLYWGAFALLLLVGAHLLWRRGTETRFKPRLRRAPARLKGMPGVLAGTAVVTMALTGGWIFYNTNILNEYRTSDDNDQFAADYEKRYLAFEKLPQPEVAALRLNVDLYPDERRADIRGRYELVNLTDGPIRDVHVRQTDRLTRIVDVRFPGATLARFDEDFGYRIYRLAQPMAPGERRTVEFTTQRWQRGFVNGGADTRLVENGTFLDSSHLAPSIGMDRSGLLQERTKRRKYGLPPELRQAKLEDLSATLRSPTGGWTTADITVSTAADQTPIAPGKKVSDVTRDGRRTARFVADAPILNFFSIQSARYAEKSRNHKGVALTVYHHPTHHWNVDRMLNAMAKSLDYYQANFSPYQFDQARVIEFPAYATFAQAFANTMPYSEAIGFAADARDPEKIDYVTYVTAHEVGHQWWAHQVIGADMQGSTMLVETLAQYSALMVMKQLYGEDQIRRFLKFELDNYLSNRGGEAIEELPLNRVENQGYIHYRKGSLVMYLLQDRLGEAAVNRALQRMIRTYAFKGAPYPRSVDLVRELRAEAKTPEDQALITDLIERITIYDLKVEEPKAVRRADGKWDVTVPVVAAKFYANGKGEETATRLADPIAIGLFTAEPGRGAFAKKDVILMERRPVRNGRQEFRFVTNKKPTHAGVDPYNFYIDRNSDDNVGTVS